MEKEGQPSKQCVACSIFNSFSAKHKDECQTTEEMNKGMTERNGKKKDCIEVRVKKTTGKISIHRGLRHTHAPLQYMHACLRTNAANTAHIWVNPKTYARRYMWCTWTCTQSHAPWIYFQLERRSGRGVCTAEESKRPNESPAPTTLWALGSSNKVVHGRHGDATNRMRYFLVWPSYSLFCVYLWPPVSQVS